MTQLRRETADKSWLRSVLIRDFTPDAKIVAAALLTCVDFKRRKPGFEMVTGLLRLATGLEEDVVVAALNELDDAGLLLIGAAPSGAMLMELLPADYHDHERQLLRGGHQPFVP